MERLLHENIVDINSDATKRRSKDRELGKKVVVSRSRYSWQRLHCSERIIGENRSRLLDLGADHVHVANGCNLVVLKDIAVNFYGFGLPEIIWNERDGELFSFRVVCDGKRNDNEPIADGI